MIAGLELALYAPAIFFDALLQKSVLDVFLVCLAIWLLSHLVAEPHANARSSALVAAVLAVAVFVNRPMLSTDLMRAITEHNLGAALQSDGRFDEAIEHYRRLRTGARSAT